MANNEEAKKSMSTKERGASFPYLSLPEAVKIIRDAGSYGKQHSKSAMASYAGHTTANSGPFKQKLAALKDWGFITTSDGEVTLTPAAMSIAYPDAPDAAVAVLMSAFRGCGIFWKIYSDSAKGIPLKPELVANGAVTTHRIGVAAKDKFIKSFIASAEAVGLVQRLPNGEIKLLTAPENSSDKSDEQREDEASQDKPDLPNPPVGEHKKPPLGQSDLRPVVSQKWADSQTEIIFEVRSGRPLSANAFTEIGKTVTAIEELWKVLEIKQGELKGDKDGSDELGAAN